MSGGVNWKERWYNSVLLIMSLQTTDMMPSMAGQRRRTCKEVRPCGQPMSEVYSSHCPRKVNTDPEHHYTL